MFLWYELSNLYQIEAGTSKHLVVFLKSTTIEIARIVRCLALDREIIAQEDGMYPEYEYGYH